MIYINQCNFIVLLLYRNQEQENLNDNLRQIILLNVILILIL